MGDHDSPISIHGGGTLAKAIVSQEQGTGRSRMVQSSPPDQRGLWPS